LVKLIFIIMTTTLKLNSQHLLSQLAAAKNSGCLELRGESVVWEIYLQTGSLVYVYCSAQSLDQLKYHLHFLGLKPALAALKNLPQSLQSEQSSPADQSAQSNNLDLYSQIILWLIAENQLNSNECSKLIESITKDELQSCLWLDQGDSIWKENVLVPDWITSQAKVFSKLSIAECFNEAQIKTKQWQKCSKELLSVHQRPYFTPGWETKNLPESGSLNQKVLIELTKVLKGRTSIRQLSIVLNKNEYQVAQILSPYIDKKIIYLYHPQDPLNKIPAISRNLNNSNQETKSRANNQTSEAITTWKIVCIDDSPTILQEIKRFLDPAKFQVTAIDDPIKAVPQIFAIVPHLILLDITMPRINGYKLCGLLRNSGKCDQTPIIMVSGNTGLIDKTRAKLAGATDYFTKPFTRESLNQVIDKYLQ
jgi:two-component system, chemotaxis family, response regulator PixG